MKTYRGYFQIIDVHYADEVNASCKWMAYIKLKLRNSTKLLYILEL